MVDKCECGAAVEIERLKRRVRLVWALLNQMVDTVEAEQNRVGDILGFRPDDPNRRSITREGLASLLLRARKGLEFAHNTIITDGVGLDEDAGDVVLEMIESILPALRQN